jgi:hypothetical protein
LTPADKGETSFSVISIRMGSSAEKKEKRNETNILNPLYIMCIIYNMLF